MKDRLLAGKEQITNKISANQIIVLLSITGVSFVFTGIVLLSSFYSNKLFPGTKINGQDVSGLSISQAISKLDRNTIQLSPHTLYIYIDDIKISSNSADLEQEKDFATAVNIAYTDSHTKNKISNFTNLLTSFIKPKSYVSQTWYSEEKITNFLKLLNDKVELVGENPTIELKIPANPNTLSVFNGTPGREIDVNSSKRIVKDSINKGEFDVSVSVASTSTVLSDDQAKQTLERANKFVDKYVEFSVEYKRFELDDQNLVSMVNPLGGYFEDKITETVLVWADKVNREAQNAEFDYDKDTLEVNSFYPHKEGLELNQAETKNQIIFWLNDVENGNILEEEVSKNEKIITDLSLQLPLKKTQPEINLESTNDLGITERIGFGESYYHHSIINRVHNVGITAERISLTIVPPGEEFSFNKTLGDVSKATGYRSAYVISGGKTVLGDGGGVCQVSSTLFRSILDAGLDVTKRLQHSYRVSYYELNSDPGFDATVYSGDVDFRFNNDTDHHVLIYSFVDTENRYMNIELYGTSDGRTTDISNYRKWDFRGPPPTEYYPTTDLAPGQTKQIDWSVSGIKTEFTHTIKDKDGNIKAEDTYYSNYKPWSAKYLKGV